MKLRTGAVVLTALAVVSGLSVAATYEVQVTNLTKAQQFTPLAVVSHRAAISLFELGQPAIPELEAVAEDGAIGPLVALLEDLPSLVRDTNTNGALLPPGQTVTIDVDVRPPFNRISFAGMLIPTNDTFVAVDSVRVPRGLGETVVYAVAYDAGTEANDQTCANIPGPPCFGAGPSATAAGDEGFVHVSNGFHELGEGALSPARYDWRNPVARVVIRRAPVTDDEDSDD